MNVSVVIPCFNQGRFLSEAIASVLAQSEAAHELCVVNDGSTDSTAQVMGQFAGRITAVHQTNQGVMAARNAGVRATTGHYVVFLDADDRLAPDAAHTFMAIAMREDADVVVGSWEEIDADGVVQSVHHQDTDAGDAFHAQLRRGWAVPFAYCVRRSVLERVGLFDESLALNEDWDMWLRLARQGASHRRTPMVVGQYRRMPNTRSSKLEDVWQSRAVVIEKLRHRPQCHSCDVAIRAGGPDYYWHIVRPALVERGSLWQIVRELMRSAPTSRDLWWLALTQEAAMRLRIRGGALKRVLGSRPAGSL